MFNNTLDVISCDVSSMQGDDGTGSLGPLLDNLNYDGKREEIILGLDQMMMGLDFVGQDFVGQDARPYPSTTDLTELGIDEPMVWGSDFADASGWDELGQDVFGWSPFKAVGKAVKKVASAPKAVAKVATAIAKKPVTLAAKAVKVVAKPAPKPAPKPVPKPVPKPAPKPAPAKPTVSATLAKSPIIKPVAGGAALVFPATGVPMTAGLATAAGIAAAVKSPIASQAAAAKQIVLNTHAIATTPGPDQKAAQVSLAAMAMAANSRKLETEAAAPRPAPAPAPPPSSLPTLTPGVRRITNAVGRTHLVHDISSAGYVTTYVT